MADGKVKIDIILDSKGLKAGMAQSKESFNKLNQSVQKAKNGLDATSISFAKIKQEIKSTKNPSDNLKNSFKKLQKELEANKINYKESKFELSKYKKEMGDTQKKASLLSTTLKTIGFASIGAAALKAGQAFIKTASMFEQMSTSFNVLLGSVEKSKILMDDLIQVSNFTPFEATDLAKNAELLLAFGESGDTVVDTLRTLGDVSRGSKERLGSLTLAFAQMSAAGRLMGQDLLQMINAGFNPLTVISAETGVSLGELKDRMAEGAISAELIKEAFRVATIEGGRFNGMLEEMSSTEAGLASTLRGEFTNALNDVGKLLMPLYKVILRQLIQTVKILRLEFKQFTSTLFSTGDGVKYFFSRITGNTKAADKAMKDFMRNQKEGNKALKDTMELRSGTFSYVSSGKGNALPEAPYQKGKSKITELLNKPVALSEKASAKLADKRLKKEAKRIKDMLEQEASWFKQQGKLEADRFKKEAKLNADRLKSSLNDLNLNLREKLALNDFSREKELEEIIKTEKQKLLLYKNNAEKQKEIQIGIYEHQKDLAALHNEHIMQLQEQLTGDITSSLNNNITNFLDGSKSIGDGLKGIFKDINKSFDKMIAEMITDFLKIKVIKPIMSNLFSGMSGGGGGVSSGISKGLNIASSIGSLFGGFFADGGVIPGKAGQPMPIIAHGGEVVLNKSQQNALLNGNMGNNGTAPSPNYVYAPQIKTVATKDEIFSILDKNQSEFFGRIQKGVESHNGLRSSIKGSR